MMRTGLEVAIIGMSCKLATADDVEEFWNIVKENKEAIKILSDEELKAAGKDDFKNPNYVHSAGGVISNREYFDANFFEYTQVEAELMNPQCRLAHEYAWAALEDAGYNPNSYKGKIGNYWACGTSEYWQILTELSGKSSKLGEYASWLLSSRDFLSTRLSYKFNLKGPSMMINTACSTSLVAIDTACKAILTGLCDMALVGSVSVSQKPREGYEYKEGMINSSDGHCRPFEANASGTISGEGVGVIVLKSLEDAIEDRDHIYAVIKGSSVNNDGSLKIGYTAPSVQGELDAIVNAMDMAEVEPESITYVETHGTGTVLGDPIEIEALKKAFPQGDIKYCAISSVKSNIGHLDVAAGMAGVIKAALCLQHKVLPAIANYENLNPNINFENTPFYINKQACQWESNKYPRRAGVSSFGIGGTNAHIILEEAPSETKTDCESKESTIICLSAKSEKELTEMSADLATYLSDHVESLQDVSYTLLTGRKKFNYRKTFVCDTTENTIQYLTIGQSSKVGRYIGDDKNKKVVFMFPGQGFQYIGMARGLYTQKSQFQTYFDQCCEIVKREASYDIIELLFTNDTVENSQRIMQTEYTQSIIFSVEYSLAKYLMDLGIKPHAMIGHSLGEYVAATIAGVFTLENALRLVIFRAEIMQSTPKGVMLSINIKIDELQKYIDDKISIATINSEGQCVVSGEERAITDVEERLTNMGYRCKRLKTSHAFHSYMLDSVLDKFEKFIDNIPRNIPSIPYISNVTGDWISCEQVMRNEYWVKHIRNTVQFKDGIEKLLTEDNCLFIELGAGRTLSNFVRKNVNWNDSYEVVNILKDVKEKQEDYEYFMQQLGLLWMYGVEIDWNYFFKTEDLYRISLPSYPFQRERYWIDYDCDLATMMCKGSASTTRHFIDENLELRKKDNSFYQVQVNEYANAAKSNPYIDVIIRVFQEHFGLKEVDIYKNFFEMGASSLDIASVKSQIEEELHKEFSITAVYDNPNISELSLYLSKIEENKEDIDIGDYSNQGNSTNRLALRRNNMKKIGG